MWARLIRGILFITGSLFLIVMPQSIGYGDQLVWGQQPTETKKNPSQVIFKVGDYVMTAAELDELSHFGTGLGVPRESRAGLVESLVTTKLFSLAARAAKMDTCEEFLKSRDATRENILVTIYIDRHVGPKHSEQAAQAYFEAHKDELKYYGYYRNEIVVKLERQAIKDVTESLMKRWNVTLLQDLKKVNLRNADPALVLVQVEGQPVMVNDLIELAEERYEGRDMRGIAEKNKEELLDRLLLTRLSLLEAKKTGLADDPEVKKAMALSEENILAALYTARIQGQVGTEQARQYYETHLEEFKGLDQVWVRQIVVATKDEAQTVKARLAAGEKFEEVAKALSVHRATATKGGEVGWVRKGRLHPEAEKVAFQLSPKQASEPIKTPKGYVILEVGERLTGPVKPFEEVASQILLQMRMKAVETERQRLMTLYKVTINKELL